MRVALDTNVLVYAEGVNGAPRKTATEELLSRIRNHVAVVPAQAMGELFHVLVRKASWPAASARAAVFSWANVASIAETSAAVLLAASDLAANHRMVIWDAIIVAAAAEARCPLLLSEDLQDWKLSDGIPV